jgi:hypothetical protein
MPNHVAGISVGVPAAHTGGIVGRRLVTPTFQCDGRWGSINHDGWAVTS